MTNSRYDKFVERWLNGMKVKLGNPCIAWELILSKHGYDMKSDSIMYSSNSIDINTTTPVKCEQTIIH